MGIEVIGSDEHKARKPYVCDMCGREIAVGDKYENIFCKDLDCGKIITYRLHERCGMVENMFCRIHGSIPDEMSYREVGKIMQEEYCSECANRCSDRCNGDLFTCNVL